MGRRVLLTGGTGFVGANLARRLLLDGHEVHLVVRRAHAVWRLEGIGDAVQLHIADLADPAALRAAVAASRPDWIFHLAAYGAYSWERDAEQMVETNLAGTLSLLDACRERGFSSFVHAGTSSEYGLKDHPAGEDEALWPNSHYAVTKAAATLLCRFVGVQRDLPI